jgi:hypothetical protein
MSTPSFTSRSMTAACFSIAAFAAGATSNPIVECARSRLFSSSAAAAGSTSCGRAARSCTYRRARAV